MTQTPKLDRQTGRTTRLADDHVQMIFNNINNKHWIHVIDHWYSHDASDRLVEIVQRRIRIEHASVYHKMIFRGHNIFPNIDAIK